MKSIPQKSWSPPRNILVAVDGSEFSQRAIEYAITLSKALSSKLTIVNFVGLPGFVSMEEPTMSRTVDRVLDSYKARARASISSFIDAQVSRAKEEGVDVSSEIVDAGTSVVEALSDYASAHETDLIIVGNRGLGGFKKLLMGSVSSGIVSHAHCSVMVVR